MMQSAFHSTPAPRAVLLEQVRAVGLALRGPAAVAIALLGLATLLIGVFELRDGDVIDFHPEQWMVSGVLGLLFPFGVWKGEERFGPGFLWTLPVDRRGHALARVGAGWVWLMGAIALFVLWQLGLTLVSGGSILAEETFHLLPSHALPPPGTLDAEALRTVRWGPEPLLWLVPFTAATGAYLLASAVALAAPARHVLRWVAGIVLVVMFIALVGDLTDAEWLIFAPSRLLSAFLYGPYGVDTLFTARIESLRTEVTLATGERWAVWRGLPDLGLWARATLLWTGVGAAALWAATSRHRERRRP